MSLVNLHICPFLRVRRNKFDPVKVNAPSDVTVREPPLFPGTCRQRHFMDDKICANLFLALPTLKPCTPIMKTGLFESLIHSSIFSLRIWTFSLLESIKVQIMWRLVGNVWTIADNKIIGSWWFASLFLVSSNTFGKFGDCCHPTGVVGCCRRPILPKNQIENHFL